MAIPPEFREKFEEMGEDEVRLLFNSRLGFSHPPQIYAREWLAAIDKSRRKATDALQVEQTRVNASMLKATWRTFYVALVVLALTVVAIGLSLLSWRYPVTVVAPPVR